MKKIKNEPDLTDWHLDTFDKIKDAIDPYIRKAAAEALTIALEGDESYIYFPVEWAPESDGLCGKCPDDPLTLYLRVALGPGNDNDPVYKTDLREALRDTIEQTAEDGSWSEGLSRLSGALRSLADELDAAVKKGAERAT